MNNLLL